MGADDSQSRPGSDFLQLGTLIKPHGFKGAAIIRTATGSDSALNYLDVVFLQRGTEERIRFEVETAQWMPTGWKLKLKGIESDAEVENWRNAKVYAQRSDLEEPDTGEFYVHDLIGSAIIDSHSGKKIGELAHVQPVTEEQDVWWVKTLTGEIAVPATSHFIAGVDAKKKEIRVKNTQDLISEEDEKKIK